MSSLEATTTAASERVCYVQCNFCNTILVVSVPCNSMYAIVTVRCGHCANLLSVNMGALFHSLPLQDLHQKGHHQQFSSNNIDHQYYPNKVVQESYYNDNNNIGSSSTGSCSKIDKFDHNNQSPSTPPIPPPEKRQRAPSAYNRFIKEEIQRIKASNPDISHREAFSSAAKNWAHFPNIHFGLKLDGNKTQIGPPRSIN